MQAMVLKKIGTALAWTQYPDPQPDHGQIRVKVLACDVRRTDLHVVDGELPNPCICSREALRGAGNGLLLVRAHDPNRDPAAI